LDADIESGNALEHEPATANGTTPSLKSDSAPLSADATVISDSQVLEPFKSSSSSAATAQNHDHETKYSSAIAGDEADITFDATDAAPPFPDSNQSHLSGITHPEGRKPAEVIQEHVSTTQMKVENDGNKEHVARRKRKKGNTNGDDSRHPILKKRKVDAEVRRVAHLSRSMTHHSVQNEKTGAQAEKDEKNPDQQVSAKPKRRRKGEVEVSVSCPASSSKRSKPHRPPLPKASVSCPASSSKRSKPHRPPLPKASSSYPHMASIDNNNDSHQPAQLPSIEDPDTAALNAEICGMLIETMALSRASSLPLSSLYKMMMQTQPSLRSQRSEQEWLTVFARVLHEGEAGKGSGVFGKVESSGKVCFLILIPVLRFR